MRGTAARAARQAEAEARQADLAFARAEPADANRRREVFNAAFDAWQAGRRWYRMSRHLHMCAALSEIEAAEARDATRARLEADARAVWGSENKENAAPRVFNLVGKSAAEVSAMASQVS